MGNSEVGHNAIGCGRVFAQGASLIDDAIVSRALFEGAVWNELIKNAISHESTLHFIGLLSDGKDRKYQPFSYAGSESTRSKVVRLHALTDGRDVPPVSALIM